MKTKMKKNRKLFFSRTKMTLLFSISVFVIILASNASVFSVYSFVCWVPFLDVEKMPPHIGQYVLGLVSLITGIVISVIFKQYILNPLYIICAAVERIANGEYDIKIQPKGIKVARTLAQKVNVMAEELQSVETMRDDFINNFSHEFKTPIISIAGFAKLLKDETLSQKDQEEYLDIILTESNRLANLSSEVLELTKVEHQTMLTERCTFNVSEQIRHVMVMLERKWSEKNIEIGFEGEDYNIFASRNLLQQLWTNLIDNAFKFSPDKSTITVTVKKQDDSLVFTVADSGKGMTEYETKHAFDKFYQADLMHKTYGNGIGLAVAKKICELHEGSITVKETGENGTVFEIILPETNI